MPTNRPLTRLGIADLEEIFEKQGGDLTILSRLKHELNYRQVPRALALQERIRKAELSQAKSAAPEVAETTRNTPVEAQKVSQVTTEQLGLLDSAPKKVEAPSKEPSPTPKPSNPNGLQPLPQLALDDACKILKVGFGDAWEKIEIARRKAVQKSNPIATKGMPANQLEKLLSEARLANDAATVIAARRCGRQ